MKVFQKPLAMLALAAMISTGVFAMTIPSDDELFDMSDDDFNSLLLELDTDLDGLDSDFNEAPYESTENDLSDDSLESLFMEFNLEEEFSEPKITEEEVSEDDLLNLFQDLETDLDLDLDTNFEEETFSTHQTKEDFDNYLDEDLETLFEEFDNDMIDENFDESLEDDTYKDEITTDYAEKQNKEEEIDAIPLPDFLNEALPKAEQSVPKKAKQKKYDPERVWNQIRTQNQQRANAKRNPLFDNFFYRAARPTKR